MNKQTNIFSILALLSITVLFNFCANPVAPTGGVEDKEAPIKVFAEPLMNSIYFNSDKIVLTFNEYVELGNVLQQVVVSPPLDPEPTYKIKGKSIIIDIEAPLEPNTTYTINFGEAIKDFTAGNVLDNFNYVFSTGAYLDSLSLTGKVTAAQYNTPLSDVLVMLYKDLEDSVVTNGKPFYFAKAKDGVFKIDNIAEGKYKVFALEDKNYNYQYDQPNELIGYLSEPVTISDDSNSINNIDLKMFIAPPKQTELLDVKSIKPGLVQFYYNKAVSNFGFESPIYQDGDFAVINKSLDTASFWMQNYHQEEVTFYVTTNNTISDTETIRLEIIEKDSINSKRGSIKPVIKKAEKFALRTGMNIYQPWVVEFSRPINKLDADLMVLKKDTIDVPLDFTVEVIDDQRTKLAIQHKWEENTKYTLVFRPQAITDFFGAKNRKITLKEGTGTKDDYGDIIINNNIQEFKHPYALILLNDKYKNLQVKRIDANTESKFSFKNMKGGSYKIYVIEDMNDSGKWDEGNYYRNIQPENVYTIGESIQLKSGWDVEVDLNLGAKSGNKLKTGK